MDMIAISTVHRTVQEDYVSSNMENASAAKIRCTVINVILHVQKTVEVNVIKPLETVQVVKLDTMVLVVNQHVLSFVMENAIRTLDTAIANLDTGGMTVQIHAQVAVQPLNVTKQ